MRSDIETIIKSIGHTPIIRLEENLYAKIEAKNPAGSIKDRVAAYMIKDGISRGILKDGSRVAEATSGNTGIGLAYISKQMGFSCDIYMPESMSLMRRELIRQYGANVILTKADEGMAGSVREAKQSLDKNTYFADQFNNPVSVTAHYETTAKEIFSDKIYDYVVCGIGTGGTIMGIKKYIEEFPTLNDDIHPISKSELIPGVTVVASNNLDEEMRNKIKKALLEVQKDSEALKIITDLYNIIGFEEPNENSYKAIEEISKKMSIDLNKVK